MVGLLAGIRSLKFRLARKLAAAPLFFDAFIDELPDLSISNEQRDRLFRACLASLNGAAPSSLVVQEFETATGSRVHYSQEGDDIFLARCYPLDKSGFFVDVGAHHPLRFSNTYALYRRGWRGINVDATPGSMDAFKKMRPDDVNIESAVSDVERPLTFHVFEEAALNTFDADLAKEYVRLGWKLGRTLELAPRPLASILDENLPAGQHVDVLNIDVEGGELAVLRSNNWDAYAPDTIVLEVLDTPLATQARDPSISFLAEKGYVPVARLSNSVILRREA
jgi:FkbM family methyltransferase